jgi:hypothetical protein
MRTDNAAHSACLVFLSLALKKDYSLSIISGVWQTSFIYNKRRYYFCSCLASPPTFSPPFTPEIRRIGNRSFPRHQVVFTKPEVSGLCHICCKTPPVVRNTFFNATVISPTQWLHVLKRRSAAAGLLGLRVRISLKTRMFFFYACCVLSGRGHYDGPIARPEESYRLWCFQV